MNKIYDMVTWVFDPLHHFYENEKVHRKIAVFLVWFFVFGVLAVELNRWGLLPASWVGFVPTNHFQVISAAFTVILIQEIISLIFVIPCSFSKAVGKQFEILALILMRNSFKELSYFPEPITFLGNEGRILYILSDGFGAVLVFALLGLYYKMQKQYDKSADKVDNLYAFVASKKAVALFLLVSFVAMAALTMFRPGAEGLKIKIFFHNFYTLLIITDILLVLVAQCFNPSPYAVFRNSGFALSTLIIRLALVAPVYYNVLLGLAAITLSIFMTFMDQKLFLHKKE